MDRDAELEIIRRAYAKQIMGGRGYVPTPKGRVHEVTRLYRREDVPAEDCWLRGTGWCLAYR
jgi:hypothetical protein